MISKTCSNLSNVLRRMGNYETAITYGYRALRIKESLGDSLGVAKTIGNLGAIYIDNSNYTKALECFQTAAKQ